MANVPLILGVDAGGTKTTAWLASIKSPSDASSDPMPLCDAIEILGCASAGPGNPRAVGFESATNAIGAAIRAAYTAAGRNFEPATAACLAVAGAGRPEEQNELRTWCDGACFTRLLQIVGDAAPVLAATFGNYPARHLKTLRGIALICGTGSMAWGCDGDEADGLLRQSRVGGWGYLLGDEGSGYWIAVAGLRAACRAADGIGPRTRLLPALLQALELDKPTDLIETIYGQSMDRRQIAQLAPAVIELAENGHDSEMDTTADQIVQQAADDLAAMVHGIWQEMEFDSPNIALALAGGVLVNSSLMRRYLEERLKPLGLCPVIVESPVLGSLYMAATLIEGNVRI